MGNKCCGPAGQTAGDNAPSELPQSSGIGSHALRESYVIERQIGKGHYGRVYKGRHRDTGKAVAIKVLDRRKSRPHRLKLEVSILEHIGYHRNVVQLLDHFEDAANVELVFELMEGGELFERLLSKGPYKEARALVIVKHLTDALHFIHGKGVVHRDLKPENLLLDTANDKTAVVKLADFGLSTQLTDGETHMGTVCGTWAYSAPEVRINRQRYTKKVDAWSLGVITFVLLSGYHPFDPDGVAPEEELQRNIKYGTFDFDDPAWERVSAAAKDLVRRLLVTDPRRRYGTEDVLAHPWITKNSHLWREAPPRPVNAGGAAGSPSGGGPKDTEHGTREAESTGYASHSSVQASGLSPPVAERAELVAATKATQPATKPSSAGAADDANENDNLRAYPEASSDRRPGGPMQIEAGTSDHDDALVAAAAVTAQAAAYASSPPLQTADTGMLPQVTSTLSSETPPTVRAASAASAAPGTAQAALHPRMDTYDSEHFVSKNTQKHEYTAAATATDSSALGTTVSDLGRLSLGGGGQGGVDLNSSTGAVHPAAAGTAQESSVLDTGAAAADSAQGRSATPASQGSPLRTVSSGLGMAAATPDGPEFDAIQVGPVPQQASGGGARADT